jgi:hypothetical protein
LLEQITEDEIIDEEFENNGHLAVTEDTVYFVFVGVYSGFFFGKKILASYFENTAPGTGGWTGSNVGYSAMNENVDFFVHDKLKRFKKIASKQ